MANKPVILIIDDSKTNVEILASCIEEQYEVRKGDSGDQCLTLIEQSPRPDLLLLDIEMPGLDGYQVCKQLKENPKTANIPIIFVTGRQSLEDEALGLKMGAVDYITKPIHPAIVIARVNTQIKLKLQHDKLEKMALFDQLTNLYNRYYLFEVAAQKLAKALRHKFAFCVMMLDIDHFKSINDQHGHHVGDDVLKQVATLIKNSNREEDVAARFGGEEFVIILDHCTLLNAKIKAETLRKQIEELKPCNINVTMSFGISKLDYSDTEFEQILKRADDALYQAKAGGRNQVVIAKK